MIVIQKVMTFNKTSLNSIEKFRKVLGVKGLENIEKILTLQDRNLSSPTYGCFDRNYWHYKKSDFPSGMSQEFVLPLALVYDTKIPGNKYYKNKNIKKWAIAGIKFAKESSHPDGSCDDYYPFEKASGAAAFSLYACALSYKILNLHDPYILNFLSKDVIGLPVIMKVED